MITIGGKKIKTISWDGKDVKKITTTDGKVIWQKSSLPDGYKECEYIENPNFGYIDTGIDVKYESNVKQVLVCNFYNSSGWFGADWNMQQFCAEHYVNIHGISRDIPLSDEKTTIICTWKDYIETIEVGSKKVRTAQGKPSEPYHIFHMGSDSKYQPINGIIYSLQLYVSDILVRDFIPVYNTETSEYGLFDKVNQKFYGSSNNNKFTGKLKEQ